MGVLAGVEGGWLAGHDAGVEGGRTFEAGAGDRGW